MQQKHAGTPAIHCSLPNARGKITITGKFIQGEQLHEITVLVARTALLALSEMNALLRETLLHNIFAHPVVRQVVRERAPRGRQTDPNRIEFMGTAREIEPMLSAWMKTARPDDSVRKLVTRKLNKRRDSKTHPTDDQIITFLIEHNWSNIKRSFPDKPPTETPRFLRVVRGPAVGTLAEAYLHSRCHLESRLHPAVFPGRGTPLPTDQRGRLLAAAILDGGWFLRQISKATLDILI
ncbi:MAG: hypothetical protein ABIU05_05970 [Nitrospirales bacterium]